MEKTVGRKLGTGDIFNTIEIEMKGNHAEVCCYITSSGYFQLERATQNLDLNSPTEVLKKSKK